MIVVLYGETPNVFVFNNGTKKDYNLTTRAALRLEPEFIFKNENKATIERLFEKLNIALNKYRDKDTRPISFHILILKSRVLLSRKGRDFDKTILKNEHLFNIRYNNWKNLSPGKYHFNNGILVDENSSNTDYDWQVDKF